MKFNIKKTFLIATLFALLIRAFVIENFRIASKSMEPNYLENSWVLAFKLAYNIQIPFSHYVLFKINTPKAGDVVVFSIPDKGNETYIKRVIATEEQLIQIKNGKIYINHKELTLENGTEYNINSHYKIINYENLNDYGPVLVPPRHFFVLGDNRGESVDSRTWGPIPTIYLKGKIN